MAEVHSRPILLLWGGGMNKPHSVQKALHRCPSISDKEPGDCLAPQRRTGPAEPGCELLPLNDASIYNIYYPATETHYFF